MGAKRKSSVTSTKLSNDEKANEVDGVTPPPLPLVASTPRARRKSARQSSTPFVETYDDTHDVADDHADVNGSDGSTAGRNPFEKRLCAAILEAADSTCLEEARVGLHVVSVGRFAKSDQKACACGQKPLQRVFHLRHKGTGKLLDIGAACAKKFRMLGDVETQEAERALQNLERLHQDPEADMLADLCKLARASGLLVRAEADTIRKAQPQDERYIAELKEIVLSGLSLVRHDLQGVQAELSTAPRPTRADRRAVLRLAILADRRNLLGAIDVNTLQKSDLRFGRDVEKHPEQTLIGEAMKHGFCREAKILLDVIGWNDSYALGALLQGMRNENLPFIRDYLGQPAAAIPEKQVARLAVQLCEHPRILEMLLEWCQNKPQDETNSFLNEALMAACDEAPENTITQVLSANAKDNDGCALVRWCARCAKDTDAPLEISGASIAEDLINKAGASPGVSSRLLERGCIHFAAAAGDATLVQALLKHGSSVWDCTSAPPRHEISISELKKGGLGSLGRQLPLEIAQGSHRDTSEVEEVLREWMAADLVLASSEDFSPLPQWLQKNLESIRNRSLGRGGADYKTLGRFASYVLRLRRDPDSCRREAAERKRLEEEMRQMEEKARIEAEQKRIKEEQERFEREERQRQQMEEMRRRREEQTRVAEEQERARLKEQQRREEEERLENLVFVCEEGAQRLGLGCYRGKTFEEVACRDPTYLRRVADGHLKGPAAFCHFAKLRMRFLRDEVEWAIEKMAVGQEILHEEENKMSQWAEMRHAKSQAEIASRSKDQQQEALDIVCKCWDWTLGGKGKYVGETYAEVSKDRDYSDWWLRGGPGKDSSFGKFVVAKRKLNLSSTELDAERKNRACSEAAHPQAPDFEFASLPLSQLKDELNLRGIAIPKHAIKKDDLVQLLQNCIHAASASALSPDRGGKKRASVSRATSNVDPEKRAALAILANKSEKTFPRGKYVGQTFIHVITQFPEFGEWWLNKGPGQENDFGSFASLWRKFGVTPSELEEFVLEPSEPEDSEHVTNNEEDVADDGCKRPAKQLRINSSGCADSYSIFEHNPVASGALSVDRIAEDDSERQTKQLHTDAPTSTSNDTTLDNGPSLAALVSSLGDAGSTSGSSVDATTAQNVRREALDFLLNQCDTCFSKGKHAGQTYLSVVTNHADYAEWWLSKGPGGDNMFGRFATSWRKLNATRTELEHFRLQKSGLVQSCPAALEIHEDHANVSNRVAEVESQLPANTPIAMNSWTQLESSSIQPLATTCVVADSTTCNEDPTPRAEVLASISSQRDKCFLKGKYVGQTYFSVVTNHWDYAQWWLVNGPGEDNEFGRFATKWEKYQICSADIAQCQLPVFCTTDANVHARNKEDSLHVESETQSESPAKKARKESDAYSETTAPTSESPNSTVGACARDYDPSSLCAKIEEVSREQNKDPDARDESAEEMPRGAGESFNTPIGHENEDDDDDDDEALLQACHDLEVARSAAPHEPGLSSTTVQEAGARESDESEEDDMLLAACSELEGDWCIETDHAEEITTRTAAVPSAPSASDASRTVLECQNRTQEASTILTFGRYRGRSYEDILKADVGYCRWALAQTDPGENLKPFITWLKSQKI